MRPARRSTTATMLLTVSMIATGAASAAHGATSTHHRPSRSSPADSVLAWNVISANVAVAAGVFQPEGLIKLSYVQAAVYDAVVAIDGGFEPYTGHLRGPRPAFHR